MNESPTSKLAQVHYKSIQLPPVNVASPESPIMVSGHKNHYQISRTNIYASEYSENKKACTPLNFAKIVPKNISIDKEDLYEENLKLKAQIKYLNSQILKLRTRVNITQQQINKFVQINSEQIQKIKSLNKIEKGSKSSHMKTTGRTSTENTRSSKAPLVYLQNRNAIKSMMRQNNQETSLLKNQNQKLKKTLKYTENSELAIQNERVHQQNHRLVKLIEDINKQKAGQIKQLQNNLQHTENQLKKYIQINLFLSNQLKQKVKQFQNYNLMMQKQKSRVQKLQKPQKYQQSLNNYKKSVQTQTQKDTSQTDNTGKQLRKKSSKVSNYNEMMIYNERVNRIAINSIKSTNQVKQQVKKQPKQHKQQKQQFIECKINMHIKQTIGYRFKYHNYTYQKLMADINKTNIEIFNKQQLNALLTHQPFYLSKEQAHIIIASVLGKQAVKIFVKDFLDLIKDWILELEPLSEIKQRQFSKRWRKIIRQNQQKMFEHANKKQFLTKSQFEKMIIQTQIKREQMDYLLSEASIVSVSMDQINLKKFVDQFLQ